MPKKDVVRLTDEERGTRAGIVAKFKGSSQKVRRAQVLLKADAEGPGWTDARIAEAFGCRTQTVENVRERFVVEGFEVTLHGKPPKTTHTKGAFYEAFAPAQARGILLRLEFHDTPKHGSWLNIAENELSSMTRQGVTDRRFATIEELSKETAAGAQHTNTKQRGVDRQCQIDDARRKLKSVYPKIIV